MPGVPTIVYGSLPVPEATAEGRVKRAAMQPNVTKAQLLQYSIDTSCREVSPDSVWPQIICLNLC